MCIQQQSNVVDAWIVDRDRDAGPAVGRVEEHIGVTALVERTPAREIVTCELSPYVVEREGELTLVQGAAEQLDTLRSVAIGADAIRVTPSRWTGDDHCPFGLAPALAATELDALRHSRIMSG